MELKEGMYVRTKKGMIAKIVSKENVSGSLHREEIVFILDNGNRLALHSQKVVKASNNIIDLIEVGDYVNGLLVVDKYYDYANKEWRLNDRNGLICTDKNIKSIVTKETFESMEYKIGD